MAPTPKVTAQPASPASISGTIVEKDTGRPLAEAMVRIEGVESGAVTDADGRFVLRNVTPGRHTLVVSSISFETLRVRDLMVKAGQNTQLKLALSPDEEMLDEIVVTATARKGSEILLLLEQKESLVATQSLGSIEISRKGISDAEAVVEQISGVSK